MEAMQKLQAKRYGPGAGPKVKSRWWHGKSMEIHRRSRESIGDLWEIYGNVRHEFPFGSFRLQWSSLTRDAVRIKAQDVEPCVARPRCGLTKGSAAMFHPATGSSSDVQLVKPFA